MTTENKEQSAEGKFFAGESDEYFHMGPFDTEAEALEEFKSECPETKFCYLGIGKDEPVEISDSDVEHFIENFSENFGEQLYEDALENWCKEIPNASLAELAASFTTVFVDWLKKNNQKTFFTTIGDSKEVEVK